MQTSCCAVTAAVDTHIQTYRQINGIESCLALHTRTLSTAALHFTHGHYRQLFCTSYTDTVDSCFALHIQTVSRVIFHLIHEHARAVYTPYTELPPHRNISPLHTSITWYYLASPRCPSLNVQQKTAGKSDYLKVAETASLFSART